MESFVIIRSGARTRFDLTSRKMEDDRRQNRPCVVACRIEESKPTAERVMMLACPYPTESFGCGAMKATAVRLVKLACPYPTESFGCGAMEEKKPMEKL